jgi:hypothetical protein
MDPATLVLPLWRCWPAVSVLVLRRRRGRPPGKRFRRSVTPLRQFVLQLAARQDRNAEQRITEYLYGAMNDDPRQLPENARAAIAQILTRPNS